MKRLALRLLSAFVLMGVSSAMLAQDSGGNDSLRAASLQAANDSIIMQLKSQIQELQLQSIMMSERLKETDRTILNDSIKEAERKSRIDSLRKITTGAPVVINKDTLFRLYARKGGMLPETRAANVEECIMALGKSISLFTDSIFVYEGDFSSDVMAGETIIISITDNDGLWQNMSRQQLAQEYCALISEKVSELHDVYGLKQKIKGLLMVLLIIVIQIFLIRLTNHLYNTWRLRLARKLLKWMRPVDLNGYEMFTIHRQGIILLVTFRILRIVAIFLQLLFTIPLLFSSFPETKSFTYTIFSYIWNPIRDIFGAIINFLPNLFQIIVIILCFRYFIKGVKYILNEIAEERLKINGFYADWAHPTFYIVRILAYSFMLVMIWPLLPGSGSGVFEGVSVFIGIIISLGSSSIVGNVMAGMVMTYMRPFHVGDFISYGDIQGFVIEKSVLVTRIRTRKNEVITIPNSNLLGSQTSNFTFAAKNYGVVVHTKVTIGYDEPWQKIRDLLLAAARDTNGLQKKPEPYVHVTALDDFYVEYEVNGFCRRAESLSEVYSELHRNILDRFHSNGVEIMSPHIFAHRDNLPVQIPEKDRDR